MREKKESLPHFHSSPFFVVYLGLHRYADHNKGDSLGQEAAFEGVGLPLLLSLCSDFLLSKPSLFPRFWSPLFWSSLLSLSFWFKERKKRKKMRQNGRKKRKRKRKVVHLLFNPQIFSSPFSSGEGSPSLRNVPFVSCDLKEKATDSSAIHD